MKKISLLTLFILIIVFSPRTMGQDIDLLFTFVQSGDLQAVDKLLREGANINSQNPQGLTPLMIAVNNQDQQLINKLLEYDPILAVVDQKRKTPLHYAIDHGDLETFQLLITRFLNLDFQYNCKPLLLYAIEHNQLDMVKILLDKGASHRIADQNHKSTLLYAAEYSTKEMITLLVDRGLELYESRDALIQAGKKGDYELFTYLFIRGRDHLTSFEKSYLLDCVARVGQLEMVRFLIDQGVEPNQHNSKTNLVREAVKSNNPDLVKYVLDLGVSPNIQDTYHKTPIYYIQSAKVLDLLINHSVEFPEEAKQRLLISSILNDQKELFFKLITEIDNLNFDNGSISPLMAAATKEDYFFLSYLLLQGADPNYLNKKHESALFYATGNGQFYNVKILIHQGANMDLINQDGDNPLIFALKGFHSSFDSQGFRWLISYKKHPDHLRIAPLLMTNQSINQANKEGQSPLTLAAEKGYWDLVIAILKQSADYKKATYSLLVSVARSGNPKILHQLVQLGLNPTIENERGENPIIYSSCWEIHVAFSNYVSENKYLKQTLLKAAETGHDDLVSHLLDYYSLRLKPWWLTEALEQSSKKGQHKVIEAILQQEVYDQKQITNLFKDLVSAMLYTDSSRYQKSMEAFIKYGANPNITVSYSHTPLMIAVETENQALVDILIQAGADLDHETNNHDTALILAIQENRIGIATELIQHGAQVHRFSPQILSAVYDTGNNELLHYLVQNGLDLGAKDQYNHKPLLIHAIENKDRQLIDSIATQHTNRKIHLENLGNYDILETASYYDQQIFNQLFPLVADINQRYYGGQNILLYYINDLNAENIKFVLEQGIDINATDEWGDSGLLEAIKYGNIEGAKALIQAGADLAKKNNRGEDAWYLAEEKGFEEIITLIRKRLGLKRYYFDQVAANKQVNPEEIIFEKLIFHEGGGLGCNPSYSVEVDQHGYVRWSGDKFTKDFGKDRWLIPLTKVKELSDHLTEFGFQSYEYTGVFLATDFPSCQITVVYKNGEIKEIEHYFGDTGVEEELFTLEDQIREILTIDQP